MNNLLSVRDFVSKLWYINPIVIIEQSKFDAVKETVDLQRIKENAYMSGINDELRSSEYRFLDLKIVKSYGTIDDTLIIVV